MIHTTPRSRLDTHQHHWTHNGGDIPPNPRHTPPPLVDAYKHHCYLNHTAALRSALSHLTRSSTAAYPPHLPQPSHSPPLALHSPHPSSHSHSAQPPHSPRPLSPLPRSPIPPNHPPSSPPPSFLYSPLPPPLSSLSLQAPVLPLPLSPPNHELTRPQGGPLRRSQSGARNPRS